MAFDLVLRNGRVVDGTGNPWFRADVAVRDGRIAAVGRLEAAAAGEVLDVSGLAITPGFIDAHSHSELRLFEEPGLHAKLLQGVTTEVVGPDGLSLAPLSERSRGLWPQRVAGLVGSASVDWCWSSAAEFLDALDAARPAVNVALQAPHGNIRAAVLGMEARPPAPDELRAMAELLARCLDDGCVGLSSGLIYPPCAYADAEELEALCRVAAAYGVPFAVHVRNESEHLLEAIDEVLAVARRTGVALHISHLKAAGARNRHKLPLVLRRLEAAREEGIDVTFDQYPYAAGSTFLSALLPPWAHEGGTAALLARLSDPHTRARIAAELDRPGPWENFVYACGWEAVRVAAVATEANRACEGLSLTEIARRRGQSPAEALFDLLLEERAAATMILFWGDEADIAEAMRHPLQMVGSDGIFGGRPHPRLYGTFPRFLARALRERLLPLEEAVRRMTSAVAQRFGLRDRGLAREGYRADLVVFDPGQVADRATYDDPHRPPDGIVHVVVNGVLAVRDGRPTGARAGRALRRGAGGSAA